VRAPHPNPLRGSIARLDPAKSGEREKEKEKIGRGRAGEEADKNAQARSQQSEKFPSRSV
jgi:hypothetical protein